MVKNHQKSFNGRENENRNPPWFHWILAMASMVDFPIEIPSRRPPAPLWRLAPRNPLRKSPLSYAAPDEAGGDLEGYGGHRIQKNGENVDQNQLHVSPQNDDLISKNPPKACGSGPWSSSQSRWSSRILAENRDSMVPALTRDVFPFKDDNLRQSKTGQGGPRMPRLLDRAKALDQVWSHSAAATCRLCWFHRRKTRFVGLMVGSPLVAPCSYDQDFHNSCRNSISIPKVQETLPLDTVDSQFFFPAFRCTRRSAASWWRSCFGTSSTFLNPLFQSYRRRSLQELPATRDDEGHRP